MTVTSFLPLGLTALFIDDLTVLFTVLTVFNLFLACGASVFRRRSDGQSLANSTAAWLIIIAPLFAVIYALLALSHAFGV
jgi:hypothetical protein